MALCILAPTIVADVRFPTHKVCRLSTAQLFPLHSDEQVVAPVLLASDKGNMVIDKS